MKDLGLGRVVTVFSSPTKTFRSIAERPTWLVAMLVLVVLAAISAGVAAPKIDWQGTVDTKLHRASREMPPGAELIINFLEEHGTGVMVFSHVLAPWIIYPMLAFVFHRVFMAMGSDLSFRTSLGVFVHGFMPWAVAYLLSIPILMTTESLNLYDPGFGTLSLGAFADGDTSLELWILLNSIDLFSLWSIVLLVIGYSIAANTDKLSAALVVVGLWAAWIVFMVAMAALE
ncbi:MAG: hypothetical protein GY719_42540 [bacterium]|nr:hypothetical protein [bacterium]